jgi:integrase
MDHRLSFFRVFKRQLKKKKIYYARFFDASGQLIETISTGETRKEEAVLWCQEYLNRKEEKQENITFSEIALGFWHPSGEYVRNRTARGYTISHKYLLVCESFTRNHIIPAWGRLPLSHISVSSVDRFILDLHQKGKLSPQTINHILKCIRNILDLAVIKGYIRENPAAHVRPVRVTFEKRGILTNKEVKALFATPDIWSEYRHYVLNLLAFSTGARLGEIRALCIEDVKPDRVEILRSWQDGEGMKTPKFNSVRIVPISSKVYEAVQKVIRETFPIEIIFYSTPNRRDVPIGKSVILKHLYRAMEKAGIKDRKARRIVFHS